MHKGLKYILMFLILTYCLSAGCGSTSEVTYDDSYATNDMSSTNGSYESSYNPQYSQDNVADTQENSYEQKLVYTGELSIQTKNYSETYSTVKSFITEYKGIIENESVYNDDYGWYNEDHISRPSYRAEIKCRIPSDKFDSFLTEFNSLSENNRVTAIETGVEDISQTYYDFKNREQSLQKQYDRLLVMLDSADSLSDILEIESRLSTIDYELTNIRNRVKVMDTDVAYSTIVINIEEVQSWKSAEDDTLWIKVKAIFKEAKEYSLDMIEELIRCIVMFVPFVILCFIPGCFIVRICIMIIEKIFKIKIWDIIFKRKK